jgi:hypothetical protein
MRLYIWLFCSHKLFFFCIIGFWSWFLGFAYSFNVQSAFDLLEENQICFVIVLEDFVKKMRDGKCVLVFSFVFGTLWVCC